jgi:hypothetical protein
MTNKKQMVCEAIHGIFNAILEQSIDYSSVLLSDA